jgi:hypothetical protein
MVCVCVWLMCVVTRSSFWSRTNFVRDVVEADEFYFTDERLVARWKWMGQTPAVVGAPSRLQYSQLIAYSTPFSDFGVCVLCCAVPCCALLCAH